MSLYLPGFLVKLLTWLEKWLLKHVDLTITASNLLMKEYQQSGIAPVINIANVARLEEFQIEPAKIKAFRASLDIREYDFLISYIGGFSRNRLILPLIEAAADLPDLCVCIWGDGHQRPEIDAAAGRTTNVRYLGWLADAQVPLAVLASDLIYYCLKADYPGAIYNAPNTLSNCLAAGRPILANDVGDLGHIVRSEKCGQILDTVTPESIRQAIMSMRNPQIYQIYAHSARTAALSKYNWALVARQLVSAYQQLISPP
jgi:glycosyltransferase involved in cell wall biosynthesis